MYHGKGAEKGKKRRKKKGKENRSKIKARAPLIREGSCASGRRNRSHLGAKKQKPSGEKGHLCEQSGIK